MCTVSSLYRLPTRCPCNRQVLHPTNQGTLSVFEPHLVALFRDLLTQQQPSEQRFVHIVSGPSVPQALLQEVDNKFQGLPRTGCAVKITDVTHSDEHGVLRHIMPWVPAPSLQA